MVKNGICLPIPLSSSQAVNGMTRNKWMQEHQHGTQQGVFSGMVHHNLLCQGHGIRRELHCPNNRGQWVIGTRWERATVSCALWRLVLGYLKVGFWRDCPATSERANLRGRTPCSPTWGCVSHWACIHTRWQRRGFPTGSDLACGNCRTWLAIPSRRSQCQWTEGRETHTIKPPSATNDR